MMNIPIRNLSTTVEMTYTYFFYPKVKLMEELWACTKGDSSIGQVHI